MKTEELNALKEEVEIPNRKLAEEELKQVSGGREPEVPEVLYVDSGDWIQGPPHESMLTPHKKKETP